MRSTPDAAAMSKEQSVVIFWLNWWKNRNIWYTYEEPKPKMAYKISRNLPIVKMRQSVKSNVNPCLSWDLVESQSFREAKQAGRQASSYEFKWHWCRVRGRSTHAQRKTRRRRWWWRRRQGLPRIVLSMQGLHHCHCSAFVRFLNPGSYVLFLVCASPGAPVSQSFNCCSATPGVDLNDQFLVICKPFCLTKKRFFGVYWSPIIWCVF